jgi:hypothetical protein
LYKRGVLVLYERNKEKEDKKRHRKGNKSGTCYIPPY